MVNAVYPEKHIEVHHPPLGFGYIASSLQKHYGDDAFQFRVINDNLENEIKRFKPDIVGISSVSKNYDIAKRIAWISKQAGLPVIIGGVHISNLPFSMTKNMDIGVLGESEKTIIELMGLFNGHQFDAQSLPGVKGIAYWNKGQIVLTQHVWKIMDDRKKRYLKYYNYGLALRHPLKTMMAGIRGR